MARPAGLGPLGRSAVKKAADTLSAAPVTEPDEELVNPANIVVSEPVSERETANEVNWVQFNSSRVASAAYDPMTQRLLMLFQKPFPDGTPWTYHGVPPQVWRNLQRSKSAGKYVNRVLNHYRYNPGQWG